MERGYKCLKLAIELEDVIIVVETARLLSKLIISRPQYHKEHDDIVDIIRTYIPALMAEIEIQLAYEKFMKDLVVKKGYKVTYAAQAQALVTTFEQKAAQFPHIGFQMYYTVLKIYHKALLHDWKAVVQVADETITFFQAKKYPTIHHTGAILNQKIIALIMLRQYEEAADCIAHNLTLCTQGIPRWFKCRELSVVKDLYAGTYEAAWETVKETFKHERYTALPAPAQESWRLYYGYLSLLVRRGLIPLSARERSVLGKFRMQAWLNDLPLLSQDKSGSNIPVIILQVHFLVSEKRFDELESRVEALCKYRQRNLDPQSEHFRTDVMIDLLKLLPKYYNHIPTLQQQAAPLLELLSTVGEDISDRTFEIEPVPYERQWEWLLQEIVEVPEPLVSEN